MIPSLWHLVSLQAPAWALDRQFANVNVVKALRDSFCRFSDKTVNQWEDRNNFVKSPGKYDLLSMDYEPKVGCVC